MSPLTFEPGLLLQIASCIAAVAIGWGATKQEIKGLKELLEAYEKSQGERTDAAMASASAAHKRIDAHLDRPQRRFDDAGKS